MLKKKKDRDNPLTKNHEESSKTNLITSMNVTSHNHLTQNFLSEQVSFSGELNFEGELVINGNFNGKLNSNEGFLVVGESAVIEAEIIAKEVVIYGKVTGDIKVSETITVHETAVITGDMSAQNISIDNGAQISGKLEIQSSHQGFNNYSNDISTEPLEISNA